MNPRAACRAAEEIQPQELRSLSRFLPSWRRWRKRDKLRVFTSRDSRKNGAAPAPFLLS